MPWGSRYDTFDGFGRFGQTQLARDQSGQQGVAKLSEDSNRSRMHSIND